MTDPIPSITKPFADQPEQEAAVKSSQYPMMFVNIWKTTKLSNKWWATMVFFTALSAGSVWFYAYTHYQDPKAIVFWWDIPYTLTAFLFGFIPAIVAGVRAGYLVSENE